MSERSTFDQQLTDKIARAIYARAISLKDNSATFSEFKSALKAFLDDNNIKSIKNSEKSSIGSFMKGIGLQASNRTLLSGNFNTNSGNETLKPLIIDIQKAALVTVQFIYKLPDMLHISAIDQSTKHNLNAMIVLLGLNGGKQILVNEKTPVLYMENMAAMKNAIRTTIENLTGQLSSILIPMFKTIVCPMSTDQKSALVLSMPDKSLVKELLIFKSGCPTPQAGGRRHSQQRARSRSSRRSRYVRRQSRRAGQRKTRRAQRNH